ncbi:MAG: hypothetical protein COT81_03855 [Candidatus Buchananbacteria bacterium CG10_big_fil_rev_8_21_14_0_10_42_9]|uniref:Type IV pilus modification protein PilV n=1 Tax=Candidatus Buchananbacteria bacterium CG10_big_fil_rev_8_21_14_0_10_42_9 TaxID=1974526 RepID=A0A2H0W0S9_9BACT|nr:MAG: hypothetical protein COT81_03855 [Candidatus Buchananbacteria bacterium CG10_big_fil_rev_8_21_14_0_10_42_9]
MKLRDEGFGLIEVIIAIALVGFMVVVVGRVLSSNLRLAHTSLNNTKAAAFAQESMEIMVAMQNDFFACVCGVDDSCGDGQCTRDGQTCEPVGAYNSCWTTYPLSYSGTEYHLEFNGTTWVLQQNLAAVPQDNRFSRVITIENVCRTKQFGEIEDSGCAYSDDSSKNISVTVTWQERGATQAFSISNIFTAWPNII